MNWLTSKTPMIIGHRGASAEAPENSLAAFELAWQQGADGIEFDVHLSADGQVVVIHDDTVDRTSNGQGQVAKMALAQLQALDLGSEQQIPTLDEVFESFGRRFLYNVELKGFGNGEDDLAFLVADRIMAHGLESYCCVSSFVPWAVRRARRYLKQETLVAILREPGWGRFSHWLSGRIEADHPHYSFVNEQYMAWAKRRGYRVHVWTVDEPSKAQELARLGVQALITNKPAFIRQALSYEL